MRKNLAAVADRQREYRRKLNEEIAAISARRGEFSLRALLFSNSALFSAATKQDIRAVAVP